eukprot:CAMPEP_0181099914 /NCGR_PEP_ID=MMETSP1071-20121207/12911_1 /TAXON_ID=35127 /ORGANISM="Thalassiosira sp., Strain NH16" /LENGTH=148 /DNA_ID=CAMNT_0023182603 /DNA_START=232 /DNA_END=675 /DNA_ORIENTATION=-
MKPDTINSMPSVSQMKPDTINSMPSVSQTLSAFRIAILYPQEDIARRAKSVGASLLLVYQDGPRTSRDEFETYWNAEVKRARLDGLTLIVMKNRDGIMTTSCYYKLKQIEENEWYGCEKKESLRFVMREDLVNAIEGKSDGGLLYDSW